MMAVDPAAFRILCIEDDSDIREDMADALRHHGFQVDEAVSAQAALEVVEGQTPNLIVCDIQMPGMSGLDFLELLRSREDRLGAIPFIFLTAFGDRASELDGRRRGADDYLLKPVDFDMLIAAVESHLRNAMRRQAQTAPKTPEGLAYLLPDRAALVERLEQTASGNIIALIAVENLSEMLHRLDMRPAGQALGRVQQLLARAGVEGFCVNPRKFALVGPAGKVERALNFLHQMRFRDMRTSETLMLSLRASIATASLPAGSNAEQLVDDLTKAVRLIQREDGGHTHDLGDKALAELRMGGVIRSGLAKAIRRGELHVCLQPQVLAETGELIGAEVLARWEDPTFGNLSPVTFIPVIERAGLLPYLTDWVLREAALCQCDLLAQGLPARLSVNIGATEFNGELPGRIAAICDEVGADPRLIDLEITETAMLENTRVAREVSIALRKIGMAIALDDFGTGFSSLDYLRQCPVDIIKLDRSFIEHVVGCTADGKIVENIIQLAHSLGLRTIAEGVETRKQRHWLANHGCDMIQGYLIARPLRFEEYCVWSRSYEPAQRQLRIAS